MHVIIPSAYVFTSIVAGFTSIVAGFTSIVVGDSTHIFVGANFYFWRSENFYKTFRLFSSVTVCVYDGLPSRAILEFFIMERLNISVSFF